MSLPASPSIHSILHELLGCAWGRKIGLSNDTEPCGEKAVQIVVLYHGDKQFDVKLCAKHRDVVLAETTPHVFVGEERL